jgi:hypothetical protein
MKFDFGRKYVRLKPVGFGLVVLQLTDTDNFTSENKMYPRPCGFHPSKERRQDMSHV